jgi:TrmH family RNA methyltransferase
MRREPRSLSSRDNPLLQQVRKLQRDPVAYRKLGQVWLEGEHLGTALLQRRMRASVALFGESAWAAGQAQSWADAADDLVVVPDRLFEGLSDLPSTAGMGFLLALPPAPALQAQASTVVLDRLQDAGNVGSILRSAAALGVQQVLALRGTAGLWSPKVLRAGMGAQLALALLEAQDESVLADLHVPLVATSSHAGATLPQTRLPQPCAWVFGHEGQGIAPGVAQRCAVSVCIPQPGGEESLNVAAAAAICLYESMRQREAPP